MSCQFALTCAFTGFGIVYNIGGKDATKSNNWLQRGIVALLFIDNSEAVIVELQVLRLSQTGQKMLFTFPSTARLNTGQFVA